MSRKPQQDRIARDAARLVLEGSATTVREAIRRAGLMYERMQPPESRPDKVSMPTVKQVRDHLRAMSMQTLGYEEYQSRIVEVWRIAEEIMSVLDDFEPECVGRAAEGNIDGDFSIYIRLYTKENVTRIAERLVEYGYDEPAFTTAKTKTFGRFSRIEFEEEGIRVIITRCVPHDARVRGIGLFSGDPITTLDLAAIRKKIEEMDSRDD